MKYKKILENKSPLRQNRVRKVQHFVGEIKDLQDKLIEREMEKREITPDNKSAKITPRDLKINDNGSTQADAGLRD